MAKKCFVISPIGQDGSDVRRSADDLYELIIEPAFETYDFQLTRGDKNINALKPITEDLINHIENSELCIIDLTGNNPNVYYECGMRHGTDKPFILIKKKGESLPFDLANLRVVDYDLSDPRSARKSIDDIRRFIDEFESIGYSTQSTSFTLNDIAQSLKRIEKKIDSGNAGKQSQTVSMPDLTENPVTIFNSALRNGQYQQAVMALKKFMAINQDVNLHLDMAASLVERYEPGGVAITTEILDSSFDQLDSTYVSIALFALYTYHLGAANLKNEYEYIKGLGEKALQRKDLTDKQKAAFYNLLASLEYSLKNDIKALDYQKKANEFSPEEPAYIYNIAKIYDALGMKDDLMKNLQFLIASANSLINQKIKPEVYQLEYAREIFRANGNNDKVNELDQMISNVQAL